MSLTHISCCHVRTFSGRIARKPRDRVGVKTSGGKRRVDAGQGMEGRERARLGVLNRVCKINERLFATFALPPFFHARFSPDLLPSRSSTFYLATTVFPRVLRHATYEKQREATYLQEARPFFFLRGENSKRLYVFFL